MSNNELLGKFRDLMEKKKTNIKREGTPMPDFDSNSFNDRSNNQGKDETIMKGDSKNELSTNSETPSNDNKEDANNSDNNKQVGKGRPTIFNLAKRFEARDSHSNPVSKVDYIAQEKRNSAAVNVTMAGEVKTSDVLPENESKQIGEVTSVVNSNDNCSSEKADLDIDNSNMKGRTSTNRNMIKNSLKQILGEVNQDSNNKNNTNSVNTPYNSVNNASNYVSNMSTQSESNTNPNQNDKKEYDFSSNIITDIPRKSVHAIVKMNEKRIQNGLEEKKKQGQRHSVSQKFKTNMNDIAKYLQSLKENPDERIDSEEFMTKNAEKLRQYGINSKDLPLVQELVTFFEKNAKDKSGEGKKRNTVATMNSLKQLNLNVAAITEENDEDASMGGDSIRLSNSQRPRKSSQFNTHNKEFTSAEPELDLSSEGSFASANSFDKHLHIEIAPDNEDSPKEKSEVLLVENDVNLLIENTFVPTPKSQISKYSPSKEIHITYESNKPSKYSSYNHISFSKDSLHGQLTLLDSGVEKLKKKSLILCQIPISSFLIEKSKSSELTYYSDLEMMNTSRISIANHTNHSKNKLIGITNTHQITYWQKKKQKPKLEIRKAVNLEIQKSEKKNAEYEMISGNSINFNLTNLKSSLTKSFQEDNIQTVKSGVNKESTGGMTNNREYYPDNNIHIQNFMTNNDNTSRYQKNIINSLDSISVVQYNINPNIPLDPIFFDVLCINCYECVKYNEIDAHSEFCIIKAEDEYEDIYSRDDNEEDYNARIYKLHESLKKKESEIFRTKDAKLISIFDELVTLIYAILINNNSIEELDASISNLNEILNHKLNLVRSNYKFTLLVFTQRISQLVYTKLQDMEKILICVKKSKKDLLGESNEEELEVSEEENPEDEQQIKMLKMELANLEKQTMSAKVEIEQWRKESKLLENMLRRPNSNNLEVLSDIVSDVVSRKDESIDGMTMVTGQTSEYGDIANMRDINEVLDLNNEEELKKYFLSIGLSLKFKYADRITVNSSIADLYEKARENQIPISDWYNFICHELQIN